MATSGTYNYSTTRDDLITEALQTIGAIGEGESASATQLSDAGRKLNMLIKYLATIDIKLWVVQKATIFSYYNRAKYNLGPTGHQAASSYTKTELSVAGVATDLTITVDSASGISNGDKIGIVLDDKTTHWTTVNGAPVGNVITITVALPSGAAIDNNVYSYPVANQIQRPLRLVHLTRKSDDGSEVELELVSRQEYDSIVDKTSQGTATMAFYNPLINNGPVSSNGELEIWPVFDDPTYTMEMRYVRHMQDITSGAQEFDMPQEWVLPVTYTLAALLAPNYGVSGDERRMLWQESKEFIEEAKNFSVETTSIFVGVEDNHD